MKSDIVDIEVKLVHETDKAWLVEFDEDKDPVWIPQSMGELEKNKGRNTYILSISQNFAESKDML